MVNRANWIRRRWLDFRQGHTVYLVFAMTFLNFITIQYQLLVTEQANNNPELGAAVNSIFPSVWVFAIIFIAVYLPLAIVIGYWHRKSQWKVEQEAMFNENVVQARMWLFMLELIDGKVTEEEKRQMRNMLKQILKKDPIQKVEKSDVEDASATLEQREKDISK